MYGKENWDVFASDSNYCNLQLVTRQRINFSEKMNMCNDVIDQKNQKDHCLFFFLYLLLSLLSKQWMCSAELFAGVRWLSAFDIPG